MGRSALVSLFWLSSGGPYTSFARQIARACRLRLDVGDGHFSYLIHFGPKVLGRLPELLSPSHWSSPLGAPALWLRLHLLAVEICTQLLTRIVDAPTNPSFLLVRLAEANGLPKSLY
jgi:hypothetical protein